MKVQTAEHQECYDKNTVQAWSPFCIWNEYLQTIALVKVQNHASGNTNSKPNFDTDFLRDYI